jgi:hypothetical protein
MTICDLKGREFEGGNNFSPYFYVRSMSEKIVLLSYFNKP